MADEDSYSDSENGLEFLYEDSDTHRDIADCSECHSEKERTDDS